MTQEQLKVNISDWLKVLVYVVLIVAMFTRLETKVHDISEQLIDIKAIQKAQTEQFNQLNNRLIRIETENELKYKK